MESASEPLSPKRGLIVAVLIGVNILCLAAIAVVSGGTKRKADAASHAAADAAPRAADSATAKTAEPKGADSAAPVGSAATDAPKEKDNAAQLAADDAKDAKKVDSTGGSRAVVTLPAGRANGMIRAKPDPNSALVAKVPSGAVVEVLNKKAVGKETWYEVKTVDARPEAAGWMHENVLKME